MEQPEARQARLERLREQNREQRTAEQPEARQARLERLRERNREQRAAEQAEARQARLAQVLHFLVTHEALGALLTAVTVTTKHCSREVSDDERRKHFGNY